VRNAIFSRLQTGGSGAEQGSSLFGLEPQNPSSQLAWDSTKESGRRRCRGPKSVLRFVTQLSLAATKKCEVLQNQNKRISAIAGIVKVFLMIECSALIEAARFKVRKTEGRVRNLETVKRGPLPGSIQGTQEFSE
jgi:hypothetical protein